jgi:predicted RNA binding protein YcfA (HicA-like mRNA interferase family)
MPKLRVLSGQEALRIFSTFGFERFSQRGSHIKLRRVVDGRVETLTLPDHRELDRGTLQAIYRQALRYIPDSELRPHFYTES